MKKTKKILSASCYSLIILILTACIPDSINLPTNEMNADIIIKTDEEASYVNALLFHEKHGPLYNSSKEEKFTALLGGETKPLTQSESKIYFDTGNFKLAINSLINTDKSYSTKFEGNYEGETIDVTLSRSEGQVSATSSVKIPEASLITMPIDGDTTSLNDILNTTWEPSGLSDKVTLHFNSNCTLNAFWRTHPLEPLTFNIKNGDRNFSIEVPDTGSFSSSVVDIVDLSKYKSDQDQYLVVSNMDCDVKAYITRKTIGTLSNEFNKGKMIAENTREMEGGFKVIQNSQWTNY